MKRVNEKVNKNNRARSYFRALTHALTLFLFGFMLIFRRKTHVNEDH